MLNKDRKRNSSWLNTDAMTPSACRYSGLPTRYGGHSFDIGYHPIFTHERSLQYLLLEAIREVHRGAGPFNALGEFPADSQMIWLFLQLRRCSTARAHCFGNATPLSGPASYSAESCSLSFHFLWP